MKNVKRFVRHAKKITVSGNIKYNANGAYDPYTRYRFNKKREDITRIEFLDSYFMVTEWLMDENDTPLKLRVDDRMLEVLNDDGSEDVIFVDMETGEVMLVLNFGSVISSTEWAEDIYKWGK